MHIRHARLDDATPPSVKACKSRPRLATLERYVQGRPGRQGLVQARWVVELAEPGTGSWMEAALRMILIEGGIPRPRVQVSPGSLQGDFIARVDLLYEEARVVIEDDGTNHQDRLIEDNRRQNRLQRAGYLVLRYTAADVHHRSSAIVSEVRAVVQPPVSGKRAG